MGDTLKEFNDSAPEPEKPKIEGNTVGGMPEKQFRQVWITTLSRAMLATGKGFRMDSPKRRQPKGAAKFRGERRDDKVGSTKAARAVMAQGAR